MPNEYTRASTKKAVERLKRALVSKPVLAYYDVNKPVIIQCDASQASLEACLAQKGRPVAFASRSLSPAEMNCAQIEKELLSIKFACEIFHQCVFGHQTIALESDHKPLEYIWKKHWVKHHQESSD